MMHESGAKNQAEKIIVHVDRDLEDLIPGFLSNRRNDVASMTAALGKGDYDTIRVLGHTMKGDGGGYGFDGISDIGGALEQAARSRNGEEIRKWVGELSSYLERVEVIYE